MRSPLRPGLAMRLMARIYCADRHRPADYGAQRAARRLQRGPASAAGRPRPGRAVHAAAGGGQIDVLGRDAEQVTEDGQPLADVPSGRAARSSAASPSRPSSSAEAASPAKVAIAWRVKSAIRSTTGCAAAAGRPRASDRCPMRTVALGNAAMRILPRVIAAGCTSWRSPVQRCAAGGDHGRAGTDPLRSRCGPRLKRKRKRAAARGRRLRSGGHPGPGADPPARPAPGSRPGPAQRPGATARRTAP